MKIYCLFVASLIVLAANSWSATQLSAEAPDFTLMDSHGQKHQLSDFRGKTVVLEWTNHDCPFVKKHYKSGNMQGLQAKYRKKGVEWLSIISSAPGKQGHVSSDVANELTQSRKAKPSYVLFDPKGTVGRSYGAKTTPHMYIVDKTGKLVYKGGIDSIRSTDPADIPKAEPYVDLALAQVLKGQAVAKANTAPYGCSIKY